MFAVQWRAGGGRRGRGEERGAVCLGLSDRAHPNRAVAVCSRG